MLLERLRDNTSSRSTQPPRIAYETIARPPAAGTATEAERQGPASSAKVHLREPLPRGASFEFVDQVQGGTIPSQFMPAVEKACEALAEGVIASFRVQDITRHRARRQHHAVDQRRVAFVTAAGKENHYRRPSATPDRAVEPIARIAITAPDSATGASPGDHHRAARIVSSTEQPRPSRHHRPGAHGRTVPAA